MEETGCPTLSKNQKKKVSTYCLARAWELRNDIQGYLCQKMRIVVLIGYDILFVKCFNARKKYHDLLHLWTFTRRSIHNFRIFRYLLDHYSPGKLPLGSLAPAEVMGLTLILA